MKCNDCGVRISGCAGRCRRCKSVHARRVYGLPPHASYSRLREAKGAYSQMRAAGMTEEEIARAKAARS